jgi:hypothetical protein
VNSREFRRHIAELVARQLRAAYDGAAEPEAKKQSEAPVAKKPPAKETVKVKTRRKKA